MAKGGGSSGGKSSGSSGRGPGGSMAASKASQNSGGGSSNSRTSGSSGRGPGGSMAASKASQNASYSASGGGGRVGGGGGGGGGGGWGGGGFSSPAARISNSQPGRAPLNPRTGQQMSNGQMVGRRISDLNFKAPGTGTNWPGQSAFPQGKLTAIQPAQPGIADRIISALTGGTPAQPDPSRNLSDAMRRYNQTAGQAVAGRVPSLGNRTEQLRFINNFPVVNGELMGARPNPRLSLSQYASGPQIPKDQSRLPRGNVAPPWSTAGAGPFVIRPGGPGGPGDPGSLRYAKAASALGRWDRSPAPDLASNPALGNPFNSGGLTTQRQALGSLRNAIEDARYSYPQPAGPEGQRIVALDGPVPTTSVPPAAPRQNAGVPQSPTGNFMDAVRAAPGNFMDAVRAAPGRVMSAVFSGGGGRNLEPYKFDTAVNGNGYRPLTSDQGSFWSGNQSPLALQLPPAAPVPADRRGTYRFPQYSESWAFSPPSPQSFMLPR